MEINIFFRKKPPIKAFTLIEIIIVIIIVGILAAVGISQYSKIVEKSRTAEAKIVFGSVVKLAAAYRLENGSINGMTNVDVNIGTGTDQAPSECRSTHYFWYNTVSSDPLLRLGYARCTTGGKTPQGTYWGCQFCHDLVTGETTINYCFGDYVK